MALADAQFHRGPEPATLLDSLLLARHLRSKLRIRPVKPACRKLSSGIESFDNMARDWHTPITVVSVFSGASGHKPLISDQQSLSLIQ
jgi:hypothetical protein